MEYEADILYLLQSVQQDHLVMTVPVCVCVRMVHCVTL